MNSRLHSRRALPQASSPRNLSCSAHSAFSVIRACPDPVGALNSSSLRFPLPQGKSSTPCTMLVQYKPFGINTCKSGSKQTTLSTFRINTYEKHRGEGAVDSAPSLQHSNVPRFTDSSIYPFLFTFLRTLLHSRKTQLFSFQVIPHSLAKTPGGCTPILLILEFNGCLGQRGEGGAALGKGK